MDKMETEGFAYDPQVFLRDMLVDTQNTFPDIHALLVDPREMVFEERSAMNCFYCGKYNQNWRCPPNLPKIDYPKMFAEYEYGAFVYLKSPFTDDTYEDIRAQSSIRLHRALLQMEKYLWEHGNAVAISFGAGSCKLCKGGCGKERCNNPYAARSPLEATGVNVIKSAKKYHIDIKFPPKDFMMRLGLILW